ncbi:MAG: crossover junction endodeoxyribonuclease RuvC [Clostridia bacterium]|nr:crossover junction endodeoxyribonuclease RuvC [Loktanella sp.]MBQ1951271.1 crossover junction endodeoxyribonuclease RuvC [Clostridia bacterium]
MLILGIDPGYAIIGWGVIRYERGRYIPVDFGAITTKAGMPFADRLEQIYRELSLLLTTYQPDAVAIEKLYFQNNQKTAIDVAQARGVTVLAIHQSGIPIYEYTPLQVKSAVSGYGQAQKPQVMEMVRRLLRLKAVPKPDDTADALAIAICHAQHGGTTIKQALRQGMER